MRILHVVQRFHPQVGGAETYVREIALEQARLGHDVTVATSQPPGAPAQDALKVDGASIAIRRFPTRHWKGDYLFPPWLPLRGIDAWLARERFDIMHGHSYRFDTLEACARASRATGTPYVASALGFYPPENPLVALSRALYDPRRGRAALAAARRVVALTSAEVPDYVALGVPHDRIDVVPPGIPEAAFAPGDREGFRARHGLEGDVVMFLARLAHDKGLGDLVAAMPKILDRHPRAMLAVAGPDAGARASAERAARRLGIAERVRFLGRVPETRDAYAACDVFVHPSRYESFGLVIIDAQAQGRAVVTTTAGGCPEAAGDAGVIVPARSPPALAEAIGALLADPERRRALGDRGRERARRFLWPRVVGELMEVTYRRAVGG